MRKITIKWPLLVFDTLILLAVDYLLLVIYRGDDILAAADILQHFVLTFLCMTVSRYCGGVYRQLWRYGGIQCYILLLTTDVIAFFANITLMLLSFATRIRFARLVAICSMNLLGALSMRMMYRYAYKCHNNKTVKGKILSFLLKLFAGIETTGDKVPEYEKTRIAIIGAGTVGVSLAEDLMNNPAAAYAPACFVDSSMEKIGKEIHGIPVIFEDNDVFAHLNALGVKEVVFAVPHLSSEERLRIYNLYLASGYKIKAYDYPVMRVAGSKRHLREFDIEELLFREPIQINDQCTFRYYKDKVVLITGGGGSIGSELCRQLAKMHPSQLIILDIYENGAYDLQQELRMAYQNKLDVRIEILSITNRKGMERIFEAYHPQIVINAAAHKHVPLMEHNCIEAVENNVFGTVNLVELCERYGTERFMMVSTDKAVNPTNVMGATKRMCEMIVQTASICGHVKYSATRFGNVLGSAGSVIPLFKRQIAAGGPITITDKRIIRYFMTIPEASQLVLQSGSMAKNGELFVLDMGQPVRIYDLAMNMLRLSGAHDIEVIETGLRPGEKLYEELLVKTEKLDKTENSLIFIEHDVPLPLNELEKRLDMLRGACASGDEELVRDTLKRAVPTFKSPEEVNAEAEKAHEMNHYNDAVSV